LHDGMTHQRTQSDEQGNARSRIRREPAATTIIEAHARATTAGQRGAVMLGDEMIDQASRKMAQAIVARDKAAGFAPGESGQVPE